MTLYTRVEQTIDVDAEIEDSEILDYIREDEKRLASFRAFLNVPPESSARALLDSLPGLERDAFLADLARECALLGIEWPADPRAGTARLTRDASVYNPNYAP